ncbi:hypothetical protein DBV05_g7711 [Lasiodiplodia theobromae]|uniref:Uncharacterized protein n=1 Tax=Lasiodiplodia theobromae TaxID=45133 RepID=A0A5N5D760_9PEZI|nr:hypothetical protein DBV05_g7711 [Lasiodiplodia theobromae]
MIVFEQGGTVLTRKPSYVLEACSYRHRHRKKSRLERSQPPPQVLDAASNLALPLPHQEIHQIRCHAVRAVRAVRTVTSAPPAAAQHHHFASGDAQPLRINIPINNAGIGGNYVLG